MNDYNYSCMIFRYNSKLVFLTFRKLFKYSISKDVIMCNALIKLQNEN